MTTQQTLSVEALKLIKDWGVWMVAVQTAIIAFLATGMKAFAIPLWGANLTIVFFGLSIIAAASLLSGIPYIMIRLDECENPNVYFMKIITKPSSLCDLKLWHWITAQHLLFLIGIVFLGASAITSLFAAQPGCLN
jgi:hypothetical protein